MAIGYFVIIAFSILSPPYGANSDGDCVSVEQPFPNCSKFAAESNCEVVKGGSSYISIVTVTNCSEDLTYDVHDSVWETYGNFVVQVVCVNQSSPEEISEIPVGSFNRRDELENRKVCGFSVTVPLSAEPGVVCSLQGCGYMTASCSFIITSRTNISCYDSATVVSHDLSSTQPHYTLSMFKSSSSVVSSSSQPTTTTTTSPQTYNTNSITPSNSSSVPSAVSSTLEESLPPQSSSTAEMTEVYHSTLLLMDNSSSSTIGGSDSVLEILVAVILSILFVAIACAIAMSGFILYRKTSKRNWFHKKRDGEGMNVRHNVAEIKLASEAYNLGSTTTIFQELCALQDTDNNGPEAALETQCCKSSSVHLPSSEQQHGHHILAESSVALTTTTSLHCEDSSQSPPTVNAAAPASVGDVSIVTQECLPEEGTINYEWEGTRPRSTDPATSYQPCTTDGYHGSIASYFSLGDIYHPESNFSDDAYIR